MLLLLTCLSSIHRCYFLEFFLGYLLHLYIFNYLQTHKIKWLHSLSFMSIEHMHSCISEKKKLSQSQIETIIQLKEAFYLVMFSIVVNCTLQSFDSSHFHTFQISFITKFYIPSLLKTIKFLVCFLIQMLQLPVGLMLSFT